MSTANYRLIGDNSSHGSLTRVRKRLLVAITTICLLCVVTGYRYANAVTEALSVCSSSEIPTTTTIITLPPSTAISTPRQRCPNVHAPDVEFAFQNMSPFVPLNKLNTTTTRGDFTVSMSHSLDTCNAFSIRIARHNITECKRVESTIDGISYDPYVKDFLTNISGPDTFMIRIDGAERRAVEWVTEYEHDCSYRYDIQLKNPGRFGLEIFAMYEEYNGLEEAFEECPPLRYVPMLLQPLTVNICDSYCIPHQAPMHQPEASQQEYMYTYDNPHEPISVKELDLPRCGGIEPIKGVFVPHNFLNIVRPEFPALIGPLSGLPLSSFYEFVPTTCNWDHAGLLFRDHSPCLKNKQVHVVGDSHGRVCADSMAHRLLGFNDVNDWSTKDFTKTHELGGNSTISFQWDPYGENLRGYGCEQFDQWDVMVVSLGSHLASTAWKTDVAYPWMEEILKSFVDKVDACTPEGKPRMPIVYISPPAQSPRQDEAFTVKWRDHRTNLRLQLWNEEFIRIALSLGLSVVDQFAYTEHFNELPLQTDRGHYLSTDSLSPIIDEVIGKLGICEA